MAAFVNFDRLTTMQEQTLPHILNDDSDIVVAAPTGSGKTLLLEAAIMRLFQLTRGCSGSSSPSDYVKKKAVYICPIKALANEKYTEWSTKFSSLSFVIETGDQRYTHSFQHIDAADVIITTPEKWDSITRRWREKSVFDIVHSVALLLMDEIHTVHEGRGAVLEAIVSRMRTIKDVTEATVKKTRFVAISGTLPNIEDFASWLSVAPEFVFSFSPQSRPVPLTIEVVSFPCSESSNPFAFDRFLSFKIFNLVRRYADGKPAIIFCSTRKSCLSSALHLVKTVEDEAKQVGCLHDMSPSEEVSRMAEEISDRQLKSCVLLGIAFHHAALSPNDRRVVETMFRNRHIAVVCTTTTLSLGINLPAHLVMVKGTSFYSNGRFEDIPISEVTQMCGRAGRPGLDDHGVALILTSSDKRHIYEGIASGTATLTTVESKLHEHIIEHVNAEIALRTIYSSSSALNWVKTTFLWVRLGKNPQHYGVPSEHTGSFDPSRYVELLMTKVIEALVKEECVSKAPDGGSLESTLIGRSMSRLYISFGTVVHCNQVMKSKRCSVTGSVQFTLAEIVHLLSQCDEFSDIHLRQGDRGVLNQVNKTVKYPLHNGFKGGREIRDDWHKIDVLLQAHLMGHHFNESSLRNDVQQLVSSLPRVAAFLRDYAASTKSFSFLVAAEKLKRAIDQTMWSDGLVLKQLSGVTDDLARSLSEKGVKSFQDLRGLNRLRLEALVQKSQAFVSNLLDEASTIPKSSFEIIDSGGKDVTLKVHFETGAVFAQAVSSLSARKLKPVYQLIVGDSSDAVLLLRSIDLTKISGSAEFQFTRKSGAHTTYLHLIAQYLVGVDNFTTIPGVNGDTNAECKLMDTVTAYDVVTSEPVELAPTHEEATSILDAAVEIPDTCEEVGAAFNGQEQAHHLAAPDQVQSDVKQEVLSFLDSFRHSPHRRSFQLSRSPLRKKSRRVEEYAPEGFDLCPTKPKHARRHDMEADPFWCQQNIRPYSSPTLMASIPSDLYYEPERKPAALALEGRGHHIHGSSYPVQFTRGGNHNACSYYEENPSHYLHTFGDCWDYGGAEVYANQSLRNYAAPYHNPYEALNFRWHTSVPPEHQTLPCTNTLLEHSGDVPVWYPREQFFCAPSRKPARGAPQRSQRAPSSWW